MLLIEHYVAPSAVHGLGVFSTGFVPAGAKVWTFNPIIDREIAQSDLLDLPPHIVVLIERHAQYKAERGVFLLSGDGDHFMNHADDPNIDDHGADMFARRDIQPSEELFCDYRVTKVLAFDPDVTTAAIANPRVMGG